MGLWGIAIVVLLIGAAAAAGYAPLRTMGVQSLSRWSRFRFSCRVRLETDPSCPGDEGDRLCVRMLGRIPTPCDNFDTDVRLAIDDITDGRQPVLSVDPAFRRGTDVTFSFQTHNGRVPKKNAVLSRWISVVSIPCKELRFAYRGRRRLLVTLSVLSSETGQVLTTATDTLEYVCRQEGYRQIQERQLDIVRAAVQVAVLGAGAAVADVAAQGVLVRWLDETVRRFPAAASVRQGAAVLADQAALLTMDQAAEPLMAFGEASDRLNAFELLLEVLAATGRITPERADTVSAVAGLLEIKSEPFLTLCQKYFLTPGCRIDDPAFMLGVDAAMDQAAFRSRLNEQYRKWNARVTHPDKHIRGQADRMLALIADMRSHYREPVARH